MVAAHVPVVSTGVWLHLPDSSMCCRVGLIRHIANLASCGQAGGLIRYISITGMWAGRRPAPVHLVHKQAGRRPAPVHCRPEACSGTNLAGTGQILLATLQGGEHADEFAPS